MAGADSGAAQIANGWRKKESLDSMYTLNIMSADTAGGNPAVRDTMPITIPNIQLCAFNTEKQGDYVIYTGQIAGITDRVDLRTDTERIPGIFVVYRPVRYPCAAR
jgi:hypothetical protein